MTNTIHQHALPRPLQIGSGVFAHTVPDLARELIAASDAQFASKHIDDEEERLDFILACDTFNLWRMRWRLNEELGDETVVQVIDGQLRELLCELRHYNRNEFDLGMEATNDRARFPFGLDPLQYARLLAEKRPINVLKPEITDPLSQLILGIAIHLQHINGVKAVLLPIEQLRTVLKCRKLVAGGAVKRLINNGLLTEIGEKAHTGKAREFRVLAKEGVDFEFVNENRTEPKPHL